MLGIFSPVTVYLTFGTVSLIEAGAQSLARVALGCRECLGPVVSTFLLSDGKLLPPPLKHEDSKKDQLFLSPSLVPGHQGTGWV